MTDAWDQYETGYTYGLYGTPTTLELAARVCELEGGYRTIITPGGQNAISLIHLALLSAGDHVLLPESVYGPNRKLGNDVLRRFGVQVSRITIPPSGGRSRDMMQPNTRARSGANPGLHQHGGTGCSRNRPCRACSGALVVMDNTWAAGVYFDALSHGVDVTMQALTKYVGGHSDLLLGR